jgi:hypothetical protein
VSDLLRRLFTPFHSSPLRWALVGGLVAVIIVLALLGALR